MRKIYLLIFSILVGSFLSAQQILLYTETFENNPNLSFDVTGIDTSIGNNDWVINNQYNGQSIYPNTPPQDSTINGDSIYLAPHSHYLHIHDINASDGVANANWNTNSPSSRFCTLGSSFCTLALTDVTFTFSWMCEGDTNAYGQVYYSVNGGPWTPTGQAKYYNQSKWRYEVIHDTAFNNVSELQFGFRWVNPISMHTSDISFSVDDIVAAGVYDSINPTKFSILELIDTPICQGDIGYALIEISPPLCGGNYVLQMSDANGSFANPYNGPYYYPLSAADTFIFAQIVPSQNMHGNCFRVRFVRTDPFPYIIGDTSACFSIMQCNNVVYNVTAPVMNDIDTACILSELDVHFNSGNANGSGGVFGHNNIYYAQLSDTLGNFANPTTLGHLATSDSFPIYNPQGNIQCVIPSGVIPACGYYIRVYSTNPYSVSDSIGPFCLTKCDVLTNNQTDIHFCVASGPYPQCDTIQIHPH